MTRGIEQTITISKMKILKRLLTASLQEFFNRYIIDKKKNKLQFILYTKVVLNHCPEESDRKSCACILHEYIQLMADALLKRDIVDTSSFHLLVKRVSCDTENMLCMYSKCSKCSKDRGCLTGDIKVDHNETVTRNMGYKTGGKIGGGEKKNCCHTCNCQLRDKGNIQRLDIRIH